MDGDTKASIETVRQTGKRKSCQQKKKKKKKCGAKVQTDTTLMVMVMIMRQTDRQTGELKETTNTERQKLTYWQAGKSRSTTQPKD